MACFTAGSSEKDTKNGAPGIFFGPSYFETSLRTYPVPSIRGCQMDDY